MEPLAPNQPHGQPSPLPPLRSFSVYTSGNPTHNSRSSTSRLSAVSQEAPHLSLKEDSPEPPSISYEAA